MIAVTSQGYSNVFLIYWKLSVNWWGTISKSCSKQYWCVEGQAGPLQDLFQVCQVLVQFCSLSLYSSHTFLLDCDLNLTQSLKLPFFFLSIFLFSSWFLVRWFFWLFGVLFAFICFQYKLKAQSGFTVHREQNKYIEWLTLVSFPFVQLFCVSKAAM